MQNNNRVRKRCDRCGHETWAERRDRVCKQSERNAKGFKTGWRCPGKLQFIEKKKRRKREPALPPVPPGKGLGYVLSDEYQAQVRQQRGNDGRVKAAKALTAAQEKIKQWKSEEKRARNRVRKWEKIARRQEQISQWIDEKFESERARSARRVQINRVKRRLAKSAGVDDDDQPMHLAAADTFAQDGSPACKRNAWDAPNVTHTLAEITCQLCRKSRHFKYATSKGWKESDEGASHGAQ